MGEVDPRFSILSSYLSSDSKKPMGSLKKSPKRFIEITNRGTERRQCKTFELKRTILYQKNRGSFNFPPPTTNIKLTNFPKTSSLCQRFQCKNSLVPGAIGICSARASTSGSSFLVVPRNCVWDLEKSRVQRSTKSQSQKHSAIEVDLRVSHNLFLLDEVEIWWNMLKHSKDWQICEINWFRLLPIQNRVLHCSIVLTS